jgi:MerR family transcriptional regulator, thiopeptide resistance regulator
MAAGGAPGAKQGVARRTYRVNDVARLAGVSVRALHHYDEIGLLAPSARSRAGYRLYDDDDLLRLQQISIGRALGLSLEDIRRSLDDPSFDRRRALVEQRALLRQRAEQTAGMLRAVERAIALIDQTRNEQEDATMATDMSELFEGFDPASYDAEVKARWGKTDAYAESRRRTARYTREDWARFAAEQKDIFAGFAAALAAGKAPDSPEALALAERHRLLIDRWFYPCSHAIHRGLADMYEADERFAQNIDAFGANLTPFVSEAVRQNAARHGV